MNKDITLSDLVQFTNKNKGKLFFKKIHTGNLSGLSFDFTSVYTKTVDCEVIICVDEYSDKIYRLGYMGTTYKEYDDGVYCGFEYQTLYNTHIIAIKKIIKKKGIESKSVINEFWENIDAVYKGEKTE